MKPEEKQDRFAHQLKVANRSCFMVEGSPARDGAQRSEREKGGGHAPGDSKGRSPWRAFGDFPRDGKVTRGRRGGAPSPRGVQRGVAPRIVSSKPGCRAERLHHGRSAGEGPSPPPIEHWAREGPKNQKAAPTMDAAFWFGLLV